nr:hypothetical protein [Erythrobacter sp. HL-111]
MDSTLALARTSRDMIALRHEAILRTIVVTATALALILADRSLPF